MKKEVLLMSVFLISVAFLLSVLSFQGIKNNPGYFQNNLDTRVGGPYESSGSTSRYALTKSIVDNHSFSFNKQLAFFASPDVSVSNGKFFSIFAPGVSFLALPLYILGEIFKRPEFFTYSLNIIFGLLNLVLIFKISRKLSTNKFLAALNGFVFLFATNALAYVGTLTQHHVSTALVLLAILNCLEERNLQRNILFGLYFAAGLIVDIPNIFMMTPPLVYIILRHFQIRTLKQTIRISMSLKICALVLGLIPILALYGFYNHQLTGSYIKIGQFIGRAPGISDVATQVEENNGGGPAAESLVLINTPYNPRLELNGFYILLFSNERGIFYFSPILLAGVWGLGILYKQKKERTAVSVIVGSALICVLTYSMFGDPWGGWAYGARYMIPAEALLALGVGAAFESLKKLPSQLLVGVLLIYSVAVAVVGTVTTTSVPPKVEAVHLQSYIPYTYQRGVDLIEQNFSNSLVYNSIFEGRASVESFYFLMLFIVLILPISLWGIYFFNRGDGK